MLQTIAQTIVSCLNSAHARGAVREPPGGAIACPIHLMATFFAMIFLTLFFSQKNAKVFKQVTKNSLKIQLKSDLGLIFCDFLYIVFLNDPTAFLLYFTGSHCSKLQEKHIKSTLEKSHVFYNNILSKKTKKSLKMTSKMLLKT